MAVDAGLLMEKASRGVAWALRRFVRLTHLVMETNPFIHLTKCMAGVALVLLLDRVSLNPDSVTSGFTVLLCISPTVLLGLRTSLAILVSSMMGTFWGLAFAMMFGGVNIGGLGSLSSTEQWELLARVPLAVGASIYTLWVVDHADPGSLATTFFSALYVQLVSQRWAYQPAWLDDKAVLSTGLVRIIAILTAVVAAFLINGVTSLLLMRHSFEARLASIEARMRRRISSIDHDHSSTDINTLFAVLISFRNDLQTAMQELDLRLKACLGSRKERARLDRLSEKAQAVFDLLATQVFLSLAYKQHSAISPVQRSLCHMMLQATKTRPGHTGFPERSLFQDVRQRLERHPEEQYDQVLPNLVLSMMDRLEAADRSLDEVESSPPPPDLEAGAPSSDSESEPLLRPARPLTN